jgi:predicted DNA-binding transcriptional regulator AlpA
MNETQHPVSDKGTRGRKKRAREDLRFRMAYTKPELSQVLPFGHTTLEELIKRGAFPDGVRPHPTAHKIWPRRLIEEWLDKSLARGVGE